MCYLPQNQIIPPLFISAVTGKCAVLGKRPFIFRYEASWGLQANCAEIVKIAWQGRVPFSIGQSTI